MQAASNQRYIAPDQSCFFPLTRASPDEQMDWERSYPLDADDYIVANVSSEDLPD
jgi:hypothetical protein